MRKITLLSILTALALASANESAAGFFEYDAAQGWWWYKETVPGQDGKPIEIKTKFDTKEKLLFEKNVEIITVLKRNNQELKDINARLNYAFPDVTPKYWVNSKGEKCLTNSSADCFVLPVQAEAQQVPVLANWLRDPSPTNSKEYLKWQAVYFNHLEKVSYGLRFSFLSEGPEAYPTDAINVYGDNLETPVSDDMASYRKIISLKKIKDKIGLVIFLGGNTHLENALDAYFEVGKLSKDAWAEINKIVVVPNEGAKASIKKFLEGTHDSWVHAFWDKVEIKVDPKLFSKMNIMITPSVAALYKLEGGDQIFQTILTGELNEKRIASATIDFLKYNNIIDPKDFAAVYNNAQIQKNMKVNDVKLDESKIYKDTKRIENDKK